MKLIDDSLTAQELADDLGVSRRTIQRWESVGDGPPRIKVGRKVFYRAEAVKKWLSDQEYTFISNGDDK